jgi:uncharacterized protein (TIGR03086 family)
MDTLQAFDRTAAITDGMVGPITDEQLSLPTPCSDWNVRDVLNHIVLGDLIVTAFFQNEPQPDRSADHLGADPTRTVAKSLAGTRAELTTPGALERIVEGTFMGTATVAELAERRIADLVAHLWDLARATGRSTDYDPELVDRVMAHYRARLEGRPREGMPIASISPVPEDATPADRLAGYLGRTVIVA